MYLHADQNVFDANSIIISIIASIPHRFDTYGRTYGLVRFFLQKNRTHFGQFSNIFINYGWSIAVCSRGRLMHTAKLGTLATLILSQDLSFPFYAMLTLTRVQMCADKWSGFLTIYLSTRVTVRIKRETKRLRARIPKLVSRGGFWL